MHVSGVGQEDEQKWKFKDNVSVDGYVKYLSSVSFTNGSNLLSNNLIHNRINVKAFLSDKISTKVAFRNRLIYGEQVKFTPNYGALIDVDNGFLNLSFLWIDEKAIVGHTIIDRAYIDYQTDHWQIRAGRQRINWGINLAWNSNDLFNAYNIINFDYEEKAGADAVSVQYFAKNSSIDLAYSPGKDLDHSVIGALYKFNKWKYDFQVLAANYKEDIATGAGWAGNIKKAGFKGEATYFIDKDSSDQTLSASASIDYFFKKGIYLNLSGLYTSNGQSSFSPSTLSFTSSTLDAKTLMPTMYSSLIQVSKEFNPRFNANITTIYGFGMNLLFIMPALNYSIKENWDINLTGQIFFADLATSFTNLNNSVFLRLRFSY